MTVGTVDVYNVLHTNFVTPASLTDMQNAAADLRAQYVTSILPMKTSGFTLHEVVSTDLSTEGAIQAVATGTDNATGGIAAAPAVNGIIVQLLTDIRGRSYRGRIFDTGYNTSIFAGDGTVLAAEQSAVQAGWGSLLTAVATLRCGPLVVLSRQHGKVIRAAGVFTPVTRIGINPHVGLQRRRRAA